MSTLTARIPKQRRRLAWFVWLLGLPLTIFAILIGVVCFRELQAARHVEAELTRLRAVGQPVDNVTMAKWFERRTSPEGTAAWDEVLYLASSPVIQDLSGDLPIVGQGKRPTNLIPGSDWPAEKDVADYLQRVKPVLDLTHAATKFPTPVWFPLQFDGFSTLLEQWQNSRSVVRLLALDAEYACYQGEAARALQDIQSIEGTAKAFDSQAFIVGDLVCMAMRYQEFSAIQRSLRASIWDADQLAALRELVIKPIEIKEHFNNSMASERAMAFSEVFKDPQSLGQVVMGSNFPIWLAPSGKLRVIERYASMQGFSGGFAELAAFAKRTEAELIKVKSNTLNFDASHLVLQTLTPALGAYVGALERQENARRLTLTAIGIKQFQLKQQVGPQALGS